MALFCERPKLFGDRKRGVVLGIILSFLYIQFGELFPSALFCCCGCLFLLLLLRAFFV